MKLHPLPVHTSQQKAKDIKLTIKLTPPLPSLPSLPSLPPSTLPGGVMTTEGGSTVLECSSSLVAEGQGSKSKSKKKKKKKKNKNI